MQAAAAELEEVFGERAAREVDRATTGQMSLRMERRRAETPLTMRSREPRP